MFFGLLAGYVVTFGLMKLGVNESFSVFMFWPSFLAGWFWSACCSPWAKQRMKEQQEAEMKRWLREKELKKQDEEKRIKREKEVEEQRKKELLEQMERERNKARKRMEERESAERHAAEAKQREERFLRYMFSMLGKLAKADGHVAKNEVQTIEKVFERFEFATRRRNFCARVFNEAKDNSRTIFWYARQFRDNVSDESISLFLYEVLWDVACADGYLHPEEKRILREICQCLGLSESYFSINYRRRQATFTEQQESQKESFRKSERTYERTYRSGISSILDAYAILDCEADATDEELKAAYRAAAMKYHPDRLRQNGVPEEMIAKATGKMAQVNSAWADIRRLRGI